MTTAAEIELASFVDLVRRMREAQEAVKKAKLEKRSSPAMWYGVRDLERLVDYQVAKLKTS